MKILEIICRKINTHDDTHIVLEDGLTGFMGATGSGKTTILSIPFAVAYGKLPPYEGTIIDRVTLGYCGDAYLAMKFEMDGIVYMAERKIRKTAKTTTQECMLTDLTNNKPIAGPKVEPFETEMINLIGPENLFSASVFQAQKEYMAKPRDLVNCKPTARKDILCEILDTGRLQEKSDSFGLKLKSINTDMERFEIQKKQLEDIIQAVDEEEIETIKKDISDREKVLSEEQSMMNTVIAKISKADAEIERIDALKMNQRKLLARIEEKKIDAASELGTIDSLTILSGKTREIEEYQKNREAIIKSNLELIEINNEIQKTIDANQLLKDKWSEAKLKQLNENQVIVNHRKDLENLIASLEQSIENDKYANESNVKNLAKRSELLESGKYDNDVCKTCDFVAGAYQAKNELSEFVPIDFSEKKIRIDEAEQEIFGIRFKDAPPEPIYEPEETKMVLDIVPADKAQELSHARSAQTGIEEANRNIEKLKKEIAEIDLEYKSIVVPEKPNTEEEKSLLIRIEWNIKEQREAIDLLNNRISSIKHIQKTNGDIAVKVAVLVLNNSENIRNAKIYAYLQKAFGKNGIQALLIDNALPHISNLSNEILEVVIPGTFLSWSTEKINKDGTSREGMEIMFTDSQGERDVNDVSGGENELLKFIIRIAIAIYQRQKAKKKLSSLFLDESVRGVSANYREGWMRSLNKIGQYFDRILIVSHSEELLSEIPNKLFFNNGKVVV